MHMEPCVLLKYGELALKGANRQRFEDHLLRNLRHALTHATHADAPPRVQITRRGGLAVVAAPPLSNLDVAECAREVFGVSAVQPMWRIPKSIDAVKTAAVDVLCTMPTDTPTPTFAVRCRRRDKRFELTSGQLAAEIGAHVCGELGWGVDLRRPVVELNVEVDQREIYLGTQRLFGRGGLPVGSSGRALVLLSGGFDSPVAADRAMRRGLQCDFLHCTGAPYTDPSSAYKAYAIARQLTRHHPGARLFLAPVGRAQKALAISGAGESQVVAQRRLYVRLASELAGRIGAQALVTGDSLGQVASQTLSNISVVDASAALPVLRPLLGFDKQEIINEAHRINTAEIATLPDQDCCQLFMPKRVATHAQPEHLARIEARAGIDDLIDGLVDNLQQFDLDSQPETVAQP